jgi:MFS family permease
MADPTSGPIGAALDRRGFDRGLTGALLTAALMPPNSTMVAVAVPSIADTVRHEPTAVTQALVASYLITAIALQSLGGKLGDRLGYWRVLAIGQGAIALGAVIGFVSTDLSVLAGARILMAVGGALAVPSTGALIRTRTAVDRRGRAFGLFGALMAGAAALGPTLGGVLVDAFGWQSVFVANLPVLAASVLFVAGVRRELVGLPTGSFDWPGSVLLTAFLAFIVLGVERADGSTPALLITGGVLVAAFLWREQHGEDPVVAFDLFRSTSFPAGSLLVCLQNLAMYSLLFELPLVLEVLFDLNAAETGRLLVVMLAAMTVLSLVAGGFVDRFGARTVAVTGSVLCLVGIGVLLTGDLGSVGEVRLPLALLGIGLGLSGPAAQTASLSAIAPERAGMAAGVSSTMRYLGGVVGIALLGQLLDLSGSTDQIVAEHHTMVAVFAAVLGAGLVCALLLPGRQPVEVNRAA